MEIRLVSFRAKPLPDCERLKLIRFLHDFRQLEILLNNSAQGTMLSPDLNVECFWFILPASFSLRNT